MLSSREDRRLGGLPAGRAREPLLLHAAAHRVSAAFHTQPLVLPWTRQRIGTEFTGGAHPQMLLSPATVAARPPSAPPCRRHVSAETTPLRWRRTGKAT